MNRVLFLSIIAFAFFSFPVFAQINSLQQKIEQVIQAKKATVGVAVYSFENGVSFSVNNGHKYPMQSVFKFHIALAVLNQVDKGTLSLHKKIFIKKSDLLLNTWSPLREKYPDGNVEVALSEILKYTVSESDNNGCDILLRLIGGTKVVNDYIHSLGVKNLSIQATEEEMHKAWDIQFNNWTTPAAANDLLELFYQRKCLSSDSYHFLWRTMTETTTGPNRIKGQLPDGTIVAHKTGTSDTNAQGVTSAINDIGIIMLPNGQAIALSVFVSNSKENTNTNEKIIADIAKLVWDYFITKKN
jgi:beta-lactamase class A